MTKDSDTASKQSKFIVVIIIVAAVSILAATIMFLLLWPFWFGVCVGIVITLSVFVKGMLGPPAKVTRTHTVTTKEISK